MAVASLMYSDVASRSKWLVMLACGAPNKLWQGQMNAYLRQVDRSGPWVAEQIQGKFMDMVCEIGLAFCKEGTLQRIGFKLPHLRSAPSSGEVIMEDDLAKHFVRYAMHLAANRLLREMWLWFGWPARSALWRPGCAVAGDALLRLKEDYEAYRTLVEQAEERGTAELKEMVDRSLFKLCTVQQLVKIAEEEDWEVVPRLQQWANQRWLKIMQSQLAEDGFNCVKKGARGQQNRIGREHLAYQDLIHSKIVSVAHNFTGIQTQVNELPHNDSCLDRECFHPKYASMSVEPKGLVSFSQKSDWFSPAAPGLMVPHADLALTKVLVEENAWSQTHLLWQGCVMKIDHEIAVRRVSKAGAPVAEPQWLLPLHHIPGSLALFWPLEAPMQAADNLWLLQPQKGIRQVEMHAVYNLEEWEAIDISWISHVGQLAVGVPEALHELPWSIRAKQTTEVQPLKQIAARAAFWTFKQPVLDRFLTLFDVDVPRGGDLFDFLQALVSHCLHDMEPAAILDLLACRLPVETHLCSNMYEELLMADEGVVGLSPDEQKDIHEAKQKVVECKRATSTFSSRFASRMQEVPPLVIAVPAPAGRGKKRKKGPGDDPPGPGRLPPGDLTQASLRDFAPPGCSIWRSNTQGAWSGHAPPYSRISFSWGLYGHRRAAVLVLRGLWERYCVLKGFRCPQGCTVPGLFDDAAEFDVLPSVAGSSGLVR